MLGSIFMIIYFVVSVILSFIYVLSLPSLISGKSTFNFNLFNTVSQVTYLPAIIGGIFLFLGFKAGMGRIGIILTLIGDITGILSYVKSSFNFLVFYIYSSFFLISIGLILLGLAFYSKESKGGGLLLVVGSVTSIPFEIVDILSLYMNIPFFSYGNSLSSIFYACAVYNFFIGILPSFASALGFGLVLLKEKTRIP